MDEKELLRLERQLTEYDLDEREKDILIEFNKSRPIDEITKFIKPEMEYEFFVNLADAIKQYKNDLIKKEIDEK